jgi:hypothetical protein
VGPGIVLCNFQPAVFTELDRSSFFDREKRDEKEVEVVVNPDQVQG